ncbi:3-hydroxyacyl-CoA dehydrogenase family protein [Bacteroides uniformis]|jgi:3-hydroxyacyl-CoA dehydrogenase|uniref:3-hydroxyacyl-CoA dehydrogenase family protein n=1 Tax=Bacteroides uniformis TaxID=820 RepID=UPI00216B3135|nr:3-hydroxyacyl-CoA dehydrogenase family protein [Bacteroides uniformis]
MTIKIVTVVGANGTMGTNVSGIFASFGGAKVYMVSRDIEKSKKAAEKACKTVKADAIRKNLVPADYSMLDQCVKESDLVFESCAENLDIKIGVTSKVAKAVKTGTICCTGSSGLSITRLAECFSEEQRPYYFGVHMFNPPYQLTLCEFTASPYSDEKTYDELKDYLKHTLNRTVVESKDYPAFIGNRIGFEFINEALIAAEQYKDNGGIDYVDAILGQFSGRVMPPLTTSDFVGLDVHKAIVDNLYENTHDYAHENFVMPEFANKLIVEGKLGRKRGQGLYKLLKNDNGFKMLLVYDIATGQYREVNQYVFPFAKKMKAFLKEGDYVEAFTELTTNKSQEADICLRFLLRYILYSLATIDQVGFKHEQVDDVMATGFTWCPPFAMIEALSTVCDVKELMRSRIHKDVLAQVDLDYLFTKVKPSKYDYRIYFRSK